MAVDLQTWKTLSRLVRAMFSASGGTSRIVDDFVAFRTFMQDNDLAPSWLLDADDEAARDKKLIPAKIVWDQVGDQIMLCELEYATGSFPKYSLALTLTATGGSVTSVEIWPRPGFSSSSVCGSGISFGYQF